MKKLHESVQQLDKTCACTLTVKQLQDTTNHYYTHYTFNCFCNVSVLVIDICIPIKSYVSELYGSVGLCQTSGQIDYNSNVCPPL